MNLGTAIKILRKERKMSQKDLSIICDISVNALSQIETNVTFPHKNNINKICKALNFPVSYLLFFSISEEDIPEHKKIVFNSLSIAIKAVLLDSTK